jgi:hypothetical protein
MGRRICCSFGLPSAAARPIGEQHNTESGRDCNSLEKKLPNSLPRCLWRSASQALGSIRPCSLPVDPRPTFP